jgi:hypothetical protein
VAIKFTTLITTIITSLQKLAQCPLFHPVSHFSQIYDPKNWGNQLGPSLSQWFTSRKHMYGKNVISHLSPFVTLPNSMDGIIWGHLLSPRKWPFPVFGLD